MPVTLLMLLTNILLVCGCGDSGHYEEQPISVTFEAAFAPVVAATIYTKAGEGILSAEGKGNITLELMPGEYFVDLRDDVGNGIFTEDGRLRFAPSVIGAEAEIDSFTIEGVPFPMIKIIVGEHSHDHLGTHVHPLHTFGGDENWMRSRLIWESARAMVGPSSANQHSWSTSTRYGSHNYIAEDVGAWNSLRSIYGQYTSCTMLSGVNCHVQYGPQNASRFGYQGGRYKGGQCKAFSNLVAYRSGVLHGNYWSFRLIPRDSVIDRTEALATNRTISAGDVLRKSGSSPHAMIVVRIVNSSRVIVVDSNWVGGDGHENIGSHTMSFTGTRRVDDVGAYRRVQCIYDGDC